MRRNDYYPFGMLMPDRKFSASTAYKYGFNGKENDNEIKGEGNQQDYGLRIYDARIGKFLSEDPYSKFYPFYSPYHYAGNSPIKFIDLDGGEPKGNPADWTEVYTDFTKGVTVTNSKTGKSTSGILTQSQVKDNVSNTVWRISKVEYYEQGHWGNWAKEIKYAWYNEDPNLDLPEKDSRRWEPFSTDIQQEKQSIRNLCDKTGIAVFSAAAVGTALPAAANLRLLSLGNSTLAQRGFAFAGDALSQRLSSGSWDKVNWLSSLFDATFGNHITSGVLGSYFNFSNERGFDKASLESGTDVLKFGLGAGFSSLGNYTGNLSGKVLSGELIFGKVTSNLGQTIGGIGGDIFGNVTGNLAQEEVEKNKNK